MWDANPARISYRPMVDHPEYETVPGLLILRIEGRLYFASSPRTMEKMRSLIQQRQPKVVLLECSAILDIEYTALRNLIKGEDRLREAGIELWLAALNPAPLDTIERSPLGVTLGHERMHPNLPLAVEAYVERVNDGAFDD
jgi:SulP family sulfate permease